MSEIALIILPLILIVATGKALASSGLIGGNDWQSIEKLSFRLLIPALIINSIYRSDLSLQTSGGYIGALILTIAIIGLTAYPLRRLRSPTSLSNASLSSIIQLTTRWNAFTVLPVAAQLFGEQGLTAIAIAMAFLIPLINIANIAAISPMLSNQIRPAQVLQTIARNPLVIASLLGLLLNFANIDLGQAFDTGLGLIAQGAIAVGLLCIGANFDPRRLLAPNWQVIWGVAAKNIAAPLLFFALAAVFDLSHLETLCGMLVVSAPAATNGYIVARQMGGDADLYAYTLSWQLVATIATIPVLILLAGPA